MDDKEGANDDWLISPEVKGGTEVTLYAKGGSRYFDEQFEVMYSATDRRPESFRAIGETRKVSSEWTEIRFTLPEDAAYFAVRYCSYDCYALLLDDISYVTTAGEAQLTGYRVYRDGELIATVTSGETSYADTLDTEHVYTVTALYDRGESLMSQAVKVSPSGSVDGIATDGISIRVESGVLYVEGADGLEMHVWRADGIAVDARTCGPNERLSLSRGIYLVKVGTRTAKVMVD